MIKNFDSIEEFKSTKDKKNLKKDNNHIIFTPKIAVLGIGGSGTNAVNNLIKMNLENIRFLVANTDIKSLDSSDCSNKIHLGLEITKGLGAGTNPEIGFKAAERSREEIIKALNGIDLLFIIAGMGGGTGTGAAPVITSIAKELNILTLGFVTKPFDFEGKQRMLFAEQGIRELEKDIDSIVVISNQNLFRVVDENTSMLQAFRVTDMVIYSGIKAISDLITANGMVNLDFNDIKFILNNGGKTVVTSVEVSGNDKITKITESIMNNPLIDDDINIMNAKNILISISGGLNMTLFEVDKIINSLRSKASKSTYLNFGAVFNEKMSDNIIVSVIANGILSTLNNVDVVNNFENESDSSKVSVTKSIMNDVLKEEIEAQKDSNLKNDNFITTERPSNSENYNASKKDNNSSFRNVDIEDNFYSSKSKNLEEVINNGNKKSSLLNLIEEHSEKDIDVNMLPNSSIESFDISKSSKHKESNKNKDSKNFFDLPPFLKQKK